MNKHAFQSRRLCGLGKKTTGSCRGSNRRGVAVPLVAFLMVVLLATTAFVVDVGYIARTRQELQNAADAAALAGATKMLDRSQLRGNYGYDRSGVITASQAAAQQFAALNHVANVTIALGANGSNSVAGDLVCGYLSNPRNPNCQMDTQTTPYNAVQVLARRDSQLNGSLGLFFGRLMGMDASDLNASATAVYDGNIEGFKISPNGPQNSKLLPFALLVDSWNQSLAGAGSDQYSYDPATMAVTTGSDLIREIALFSVSGGSPGNFGTINLGQSSNSTATLRQQILNGPGASDLANLPGGQLALGSDGTVSLTGNPGISAGMESSLQSIIGRPRIVPLYRTLSGNGANAQYTIIGFGGVVVTKAQLTGPNKAILVQPEFVQDSTAFTGGPVTNSRFIYSALQLCR
jgi:Flp pilus assembly protein TadG